MSGVWSKASWQHVHIAASRALAGQTGVPYSCCCDAAVADLGDVPGCSPPSIDASNLGSFGCELWTGMCMDQVREDASAATPLSFASLAHSRVASRNLGPQAADQG